MKKAFFSILFLLLCAAAVFILGWVQIFVPIGKFGILVSKTSGIDPVPIENGQFTWKWERIIPTNADLRIFSVQSFKEKQSVSGMLPSGDIYSKVTAGLPDFSYEYTIEISLSVKSESLPVLVEELNIKTQDELDSWTELQAEAIARDTVQYVISNPSTADAVPGSFDSMLSITDSINTVSRYPFVEIQSISITPVKQPDLHLYALARQTYEAYEIQTNDRLSQKAAAESNQAAEEFFLFERYRELGKLLNEYPILLKYFAVQQDNTQEAFANLEIIDKQQPIKPAAEDDEETQD